MIFLFFLLYQFALNAKIEIYQEEALLGEPIISISSIPFEEILNFNDGFYIEFEGSKHYCINLKEAVRDLGLRRTDISKFIKDEGQYKISFIFDPTETCKMEGLSKEEKEENERIKEEIEKAKKEKRFMDMLNLTREIKEDKEQWMESAKKNGNFFILGEKNIKISYPIDFDKEIYLNLLLKESSFWENYNEKMEEILKHPESNYFPWALYLYIKKSSGLLTPIRNEAQFGELEKNLSIIKKSLLEPPETDDRQKGLLKNLVEKIDILERRFKEFPFFDEIEFERVFISFVLKEKKDEIIKRGEIIIKNSKNNKLKEITEKIIDFAKKEYNQK